MMKEEQSEERPGRETENANITDSVDIKRNRQRYGTNRNKLHEKLGNGKMYKKIYKLDSFGI